MFQSATQEEPFAIAKRVHWAGVTWDRYLKPAKFKKLALGNWEMSGYPEEEGELMELRFFWVPVGNMIQGSNFCPRFFEAYPVYYYLNDTS